jgi:hypothetical protein
MNANELLDTIESLVDDREVGLQNLLAVLSQLCLMKSAHVQADWQDAILAKDYQRAAAYIATARARIRANTALQ